jgi:heparan sulfate N-deacetylase/N-sulfotransferase NDST2
LNDNKKLIIYLLINRLIRIPPKPKFRCHSHFDDAFHPPMTRMPANSHISNAQLRLDPKVLVFVETQYSKLGKQIIEILESSRIK